jgi:hypothetical protein
MFCIMKPPPTSDLIKVQLTWTKEGIFIHYFVNSLSQMCQCKVAQLSSFL